MTGIDVDDDLVERVMSRYGLRTKRKRWSSLCDGCSSSR